MNHPNDIGNLYRRFGGDPAGYQEITREDEAQQARQRWPILQVLRAAADDVPAVRTDGGHLSARSDVAYDTAVHDDRSVTVAQAPSAPERTTGMGLKGLRRLFTRGLRSSSAPAAAPTARIEPAPRFGALESNRNVSMQPPPQAVQAVPRAASDEPSSVLPQRFAREVPAVEQNDLHAIFRRISELKRAQSQEPGAGS
jgi:hypothetical protein